MPKRLQPISVFEHKVIQDELSDGEKKTLNRLRGPSREKLFDVGWQEVKTTSFVGVVQLATRTIQVLPKMFREETTKEETREREATANLLFLLSYTRRLDITEPEIARLTEQRAPLSEILYWIFAHRLWRAVRWELLRGYVTIEDRLDVLKGRWLVAAQCRRPDGWRLDRFDVAFDEFTEDNMPNRLFKATVEKVFRWARRADTLSKLAQLRSAFADVADHTPRVQDFDAANRWMISHRRRVSGGQLYRPLLNLARLFLVGAGPQASPGQLDTFAFLFDMNQLFEEFIAEFIRRELGDVWQTRGWTMHPQSGTEHLLCDQSAKNLFKLVPDIRFETSGGKTDLIIDTKYKLLDSGDAKTGIVEADAYQMFAYKERYRCPRVILLYPQASEKIALDFSADADSPSWLEVQTVDLRRDLRKEKSCLRSELKTILTRQETRL